MTTKTIQGDLIGPMSKEMKFKIAQQIILDYEAGKALGRGTGDEVQYMEARKIVEHYYKTSRQNTIPIEALRPEDRTRMGIAMPAGSDPLPPRTNLVGSTPEEIAKDVRRTFDPEIIDRPNTVAFKEWLSVNRTPIFLSIGAIVLYAIVTNSM